ncbi:unnamed protein product, partial [Ectocarpus sp. 12 AP-2014]
RAEAPPSRVSKVRKALRVLFIGPGRVTRLTRETRLTVASAVGVYKTPAIASVLVLTGVLGTCFGPWVLDALGAKDPVVRAIIQGGTSSVLGIEAVSEPQEVNRKRPDGSHRRCWHDVGQHPVGSVGLAVDSVGFEGGGGRDGPISITGLRKDRDMLTFVLCALVVGT